MGGGIFLTARGKSACLFTALYYRADKYILCIICYIYGDWLTKRTFFPLLRVLFLESIGEFSCRTDDLFILLS